MIRNTRLFTTFLLLLFFAQSNLIGQDDDIATERNCATMDYLKLQLEADPDMEERMKRIEHFTQEYINQQQNQSGSGLEKNLPPIYTIPVV